MLDDEHKARQRTAHQELTRLRELEALVKKYQEALEQQRLAGAVMEAAPEGAFFDPHMRWRERKKEADALLRESERRGLERLASFSHFTLDFRTPVHPDALRCGGHALTEFSFSETARHGGRP